MIDARLALFLQRPSAEMLGEDSVGEIFVDPAGMVAFWIKEYLEDLIDAGAGKVKFLKGRSGAGKTHFLRILAREAAMRGFLVAPVNAMTVRLASVDELYRAVSLAFDWESVLDGCARHLIRNQLGYSEYPLGVREFRAWAETREGRSQTALLADIRKESDLFVQKLDIHPVLREPLRASLIRRLGEDLADESGFSRFVRGERLVRRELASLGAARNIERKNARAVLFSLATLARAAAFRGLVILVDDAQVMARAGRTDGVPNYTRGARDQAFEMIRELIDDSHLSPHLFTVVAGETDLFENQRTGFPSYPALWERIKVGIRTVQVNRFQDVIDLDEIWRRDGVQRVRERWNAAGRSIRLDGPDPEAPADTWGLEWGAPRRAVEQALRSAEGGA